MHRDKNTKIKYAFSSNVTALHSLLDKRSATEFSLNKFTSQMFAPFKHLLPASVKDQVCNLKFYSSQNLLDNACSDGLGYGDLPYIRNILILSLSITTF